MPDILDLLDRTTPTDLPPLDLPGLAAQGQRRRQRRRALAAAPLAALLVLGAVVLLRPDLDADEPTILGGVNLSEPVGTWTRAADPPLPAGLTPAYRGKLSDGRVVVWGGVTPNPRGNGDGDGLDDKPITYTDGAIYDPEADSWQEIPPAPLTGLETGGGSVIDAQISEDRLAVVTGSWRDTSITAAVFDFATGSWTAAPPQTTIPTFFDGMVWDGTTLAIVRLEQGLRFDDPADRVTAPVTLRWPVGSDTWTTGAPPPLPMRFGSSEAAEGGLLAMWGGIGENRRGPRNDGALYDLATDTWTLMSASSLRGRVHPSAAWQDGRLLIGGGTDRLDNPGEYFSDAAWFDPATGTWTNESPAPHGGAGPLGDYVVAGSKEGNSGPQPVWYLGPAGWEIAPLRGLHTVSGVTVGTSEPIGNPGDGRFEIKVRAAKEAWLQAAEAPFTNRMDAVVVASGDKLVVVGGLEGSEIEPVVDAWVWDIDG